MLSQRVILIVIVILSQSYYEYDTIIIIRLS